MWFMRTRARPRLDVACTVERVNERTCKDTLIERNVVFIIASSFNTNI